MKGGVVLRRVQVIPRKFTRREVLGTLGGLAALPLSAQEEKADFTLHIGPASVELAPKKVISTKGYNGMSPGPLLRVREGQTFAVDVYNDTDTPELFEYM
jgi:FtsP/CotA-like multicopper oxidase with cupredoxin domain